MTAPGPDNPALALLMRLAPLLRDGPWEHGDPAPTFEAAAPAGVEMTGRPAGDAVGTAAGARFAAEQALAAVASVQPQLNLFTTVLEEQVLADAEALDRAGGRGPLHAMTVAVKDLFDVRGVVTLAGSRVRRGTPPAVRDATVVSRLRAAGALVVGATNMDEFAYGFSTENSHYGPTRNPHDPRRVAGGSSGGSAAAVAAGVVRAALGTDTNGSVRIPAAFCGVFGLRPTYGLLPRTGSVLFAPSLDTVGPIAGSVADLALLLEVLAGPDGEDPTCVSRAGQTSTRAPGNGLDGLRIARADGELWEDAIPEVGQAAERVAQALSAERAIAIPEVGRARAAAMLITAAEGADQHQQLLRSRPELLDPRTRDRFLAGLSVAATDYMAAQRFRRWWQREVLEALAGVDVLVLPTVACLPPLIDQPEITIGDVSLPLGAVLGRFTQPLGLIGLPALTVPAAEAVGLPIGVQLVGRPFGEAALFAAADCLEAAGIARCRVPAVGVRR